MLSIPVIFICSGFTAFAEDFVSTSVELSESFDEIIDIEEVLSTDIEEPVEVIEYPLDLESLSGEEELPLPEALEDRRLPGEELPSDESGLEEAVAPDENHVSDETPAIVQSEQEPSLQLADVTNEETHTEPDVSSHEGASQQPEEINEGHPETDRHRGGEEDTAESADAVNALIEWGEMLFSCHEQSTDQGLSYYWVCDDGSNIVTVTNTSETTPIRACYSYEPNMDGFCAPLYAFPSAEEAEAAGREMTLDGFDAHNLAEGFNGDMIAPGETETWYVIFTDAPDAERALSEEDYLSVGRLSATLVPAE